MSRARAKKIKLVIFDVDGVMTDGGIWLFPAPGGVEETVESPHPGGAGFGFQSAVMIEAKGFHAHDGTGISLLRLGGIKTAIITKRISETVALRARDLQIDYVYQGRQDKIAAFEEILEKEGIAAAEVCYVGDDVIDLPVMRVCGLAIAVANARAEVKKESHFVTKHEGGHGACRDAVEYILKAQGKWQRVVDEYIGERSPKSGRSKK